jgi:hypothetical protein
MILPLYSLRDVFQHPIVDVAIMEGKLGKVWI